MSTHPVVIERVEGGSIEIEVKRFCVPGFVLKTKCPKCNSDYERDFGEHYLSYPIAGVPFDETLYCGQDLPDGSSCDHEWEVRLQLDISLSVAKREEG